MKFKIQMKDPDGVSSSITDAIAESVAAMDLPDDEKELLEETRTEKVNETLREWFEYGEYVTIEVDTDTMTATVCKAKE
jgi:hypothetical protein